MQHLIILKKNITILYYQDCFFIKGFNSQVMLKSLSINVKIVDLFIIFNSTSCIYINTTFNKNSLSLAIDGVVKLFYKKLTIIGIGFKGWLLNTEKILTLKFGYSKNILLKIPKEVTINFLRTNLMIIKGPSREITNLVSGQIRSLKRINIYKKKGILNENEAIQLKPGKQK